MRRVPHAVPRTDVGDHLARTIRQKQAMMLLMMISSNVGYKVLATIEIYSDLMLLLMTYLDFQGFKNSKRRAGDGTPSDV